MAWNPRYLAYCNAFGRTPEQQLAHDYAQFPGGIMCGFLLWIDALWRAFDGQTHAHWNQYGFDVWLAEMTAREPK